MDIPNVFTVISWVLLVSAGICAHSAVACVVYIRAFHWEEWKRLGDLPHDEGIRRIQEMAAEAKWWPIFIARRVFK
jgi:hypothetical protein